MDGQRAHFVVLSERSEDVRQQMSHFLRAWREVPPPPLGIDDEALARVESSLGCPLPAVLRGLHRELGTLVGGFFRDGSNALCGAQRCRIVSEFNGPLRTKTLVIGEERYGALWGVRLEDAGLPDPQIRCIDTGGEEIDGLFSMTEFLVGLLFRSTVSNAPLRYVVERSLGGAGLAERIHGELLRHFPSWDRGNEERECGFLAHIEGEEIIAALTEDDLRLGLRSQAAISTLPDPLPDLIAQLEREG